MSKRILFVLSFISFFSQAATLEEVIHEHIKATQSTEDAGYAVAIIQGDRVTLSKGFGYRDREAKLLVDNETLFQIASTSKAFTSMAVKIAEKRGLVSIDTPLIKYLPDFKLINDEVTAQLTLKDALTHQSGLPRHDPLWIFTPLTRENLVTRLQYLQPNPKPEFGFRKTLQYNNLMYLLAGYVLEKVQNESWDSIIRKEIFQPLNMTQSVTSLPEMLASSNQALPYERNDKGDYINADNVGPAGSLCSNVNDLSKWVMSLLNGSQTPKGEPLVPLDLFNQIFERLIPYPSLGKEDYGLGWVIGEAFGEKVIGHGGSLRGYSTFVSFMPDKKIGLVILSNQWQERNVYDELPARIYAHLLGVDKTDGVQAFPKFFDGEEFSFGQGVESRSSIEVDAKTQAKFIGKYLNDGYGPMAVVEKNEKLYLNWYKNLWELKAIGGDHYYVKVWDTKMMDASIPLSFQKDGDKVVSMSLILESAVDPIKFRKMN